MIQKPTNLIFPEFPLEGDPLVSAWAQELSNYLARAIQTFNVPGLITGFTAEANSATIVLRWNADTASTQYRVYRNTTGDFETATLVRTVVASKTGVASLSTQDSQDSSVPQRFYWVQGVNDRNQTGPQSAMATVTNFSGITGNTSLGTNAQSSGTNSTAIGTDSVASATESTALGYSAEASGTDSLALGTNSTASGASSVASGDGATASGSESIALGQSSTAAGQEAIAIGQGSNSTGFAGIAIGFGATISSNSLDADYSIAIGQGARNFDASDDYRQSFSVGRLATPNQDNQVTFGAASSTGSDNYFKSMRVGLAGNGQFFSVVVGTAELTTIAAGATTDTVIQIPANVVVRGVSVRTTTAIPTAATYTVTGATSGTVFSTAPVNTAANSTDKGNAAGAYYNAAAQAVRITPNLVPAANTGRVRVTIIYEDITPPTS